MPGDGGDRRGRAKWPARCSCSSSGAARGAGQRNGQEDPNAPMCPRCQRNKLGWNRKARKWFEVCFNCDTGRFGP